MTPHRIETLAEGVELHLGDCLAVLDTLADGSIDSVVCDPPYHLTSIVKRFGSENAAPAQFGKDGAYARASRGFMGKQWDGGDIAFQPETWAKVLRVLKPGGHLVAFSGTRTYHRMAVAIEDAGFEIRDQLAWAYGSGFPKSMDISKAIDKAAGAERTKVRVDAAQCRNPKAVAGGRDGMEGASRPWIEKAMSAGFHEKDSDEPANEAARQWAGWGTALKPAWEPICLARKPLSEKTVAANVLKWGTGALNIDATRIATLDSWGSSTRQANDSIGTFKTNVRTTEQNALGRWPANLCHDGSEGMLSGFPESKSTGGQASLGAFRNGDVYGIGRDEREKRDPGFGDNGSAARFFYTAKADSFDRAFSRHPTVKPVSLMRWLVRMVTPKGGVVMDCFAGTGTTGQAAMEEGFRAVLIEREAEYQEDIRRRISLVFAGEVERSKHVAQEPIHALPLFGVAE